MGTLQIVRGRQQTALKVALYGTEGVGKTSIAARFPEPLILDTEKGSNQLDVARVRITSWNNLRLAFQELAVSPQGFKTVIVDSLDWAERLCRDQVCADAGKKSLEDWAYGKGLVLWAETFGKLLAWSDKLIDAGINVVMVAHSKTVKVSPPDQSEGYDRYELDLDKRNAPAVKEWADILLFCNFRTKVVEGGDGKARAIGGKERIMFAERAAAWDAKSRYPLPESMPLSIDPLRSLLGMASLPTANPQSRAGWLERVALAEVADDLDAIADEGDAAVTAGDMTESQGNRLDAEINKRRAAIEPQEVADA